MKIEKVEAIEILDSRGNPTLETYLWVDGRIVAKATVPSGASTGEHEACELRDQDPKRFFGKGVLKAVDNVNGPLNEVVKGNHVEDQEKIDQLMIEADGTKNKTKYGANAILSISIAVAKARAFLKGIPLYEAIRKQKNYLLPCPMMNIINGGAHADNSIDFQEFMIRPHGAKSMHEAVRMGSEIFHTLKKLLKAQGHVTNVGDEGGFAPNLASTQEALDLITQAITDAGYEPKKQVSLALDCASSELFDKAKGKYVEKYSKEKRELSSSQLIDELEMLVQKYPIDSIEDGLDENDWDGWVEMTKRLGEKIQVVGDDIFVTNKKFLQKGIELGVGNSILIKLNQIGTLTETLQTIDLAQKANYTTVISHRSGETADSTIADLAVATNSGQIKTGSLCRSDRMTKYNRLIEIEYFLQQSGSFRDSNRFH